MNLILAIPMEMRLPILGLFGVMLGVLVNWAVYRWAYFRRAIGPWTPPDPKAPPRRFDDRVPIFGWLGLRRESDVHGPGFWIRPMVVEILCGVGLAWLYWFEIGRQGLYPVGSLPNPLPVELAQVLHVQFATHVLLVFFMLVGSLIDADEKIIPDTVTLPMTLVGLVLAAIYPWSLLPDFVLNPNGDWNVQFLNVFSPHDWSSGPAWFCEMHALKALMLGLAFWWIWCFALMPRTWYNRHGRLRAFGLMVARLRRERATCWFVGLGLLGSIGITTVWYFGTFRWIGLLTALVGMAASGGIIWAVRVIGTASLGREAMGFGDVTLMGMLGTFLGWQSGLLVFFLAPLAGLVIGLMTLILRRESEIPYGPFLCLAALVVIVRWVPLWLWAQGIFRMGMLIPIILIFCLLMMGLMLGTWRLIRGIFG